VASFAQNILDLRAAGCDIIVDDVQYYIESPFQDGLIAQAVNSVTASGALYFSSAGNSGNVDDGTAGTWEGDFVSGGAVGAPLNSKGGLVHSFGAATYNTVLSGGSIRRADLFWADPWGASTNDYDLYVLDASGSNVVHSSVNFQSGSQDPYESVNTLNVGERIVIVKVSGAARFLHLDTGRAWLSISTRGKVRSHACATNAFCVAAVAASTSFPNSFVGGVTNPVETFCSDGPRRVFFQANGTAITPGNFSATGGAVRQKPDIAAADGVTTSVPGFYSFFGTSAAGPHAAAIAALLKSYNPALTTTQIRNVMTNSALDIEATGFDQDSGSGIVMAFQALQAAPVPSPAPKVVTNGWTLLSEGCVPANGVIDPAETVTLDFSLKNTGTTNATNLVATL